MRSPNEQLLQRPWTSVDGGFTLIELILVMAILTVAISLTAPALGNFFRGRSLDSEARRLLALTRQGQSRAVSEGVPMELWVDVEAGRFGLEVEPSYEQNDTNAVNFELAEDMRIEVVELSPMEMAADTVFSTTPASAALQPLLSNHPNLPVIRFQPDGSISETSPQALRLTGREGGSLWLVQSRNRVSYEIQTRGN